MSRDQPTRYTRLWRRLWSQWLRFWLSSPLKPHAFIIYQPLVPLSYTVHRVHLSYLHSMAPHGWCISRSTPSSTTSNPWKRTTTLRDLPSFRFWMSSCSQLSSTSCWATDCLLVTDKTPLLRMMAWNLDSQLPSMITMILVFLQCGHSLNRLSTLIWTQIWRTTSHIPRSTSLGLLSSHLCSSYGSSLAWTHE